MSIGRDRIRGRLIGGRPVSDADRTLAEQAKAFDADRGESQVSAPPLVQGPYVRRSVVAKKAVPEWEGDIQDYPFP